MPAANVTPPGCLSIPRAALWLGGVSSRLVWGLLASGDLPSVRVGRRRLVRVADLEEFAARRARQERERLRAAGKGAGG